MDHWNPRLSVSRAIVSLVYKQMKRKLIIKIVLWSLLSVVVLILLGMVWLHLQLNGDIPQVVDRHDVLYEKTVDVQPTSGSIWFASTGWHNPTDYFRLHLSQEDFEKSDISKLPTANAEKGMLGGPIWWNPGQNAQYYQSPGMRHGFQDLYIYDAKRGLLFARCEL